MIQRCTIEISGGRSKNLPLELQNVRIQEEWELCVCTTIDDFKKSKRNVFLLSLGIFYNTQTNKLFTHNRNVHPNRILHNHRNITIYKA
jgi:hypothetical protein